MTRIRPFPGLLLSRLGWRAAIVAGKSSRNKKKGASKHFGQPEVRLVHPQSKREPPPTIAIEATMAIQLESRTAVLDAITHQAKMISVRSPRPQIVAEGTRTKHALEKKGSKNWERLKSTCRQCYMAQSFGGGAIVRPVSTPNWAFPAKFSVVHA